MVFGWTIAVAGAADLRVGPGRPFSEVQDAVVAAKPGDRILVDAGSYGPLTVGVDVEIIGLGPAVITATEGQAVDIAANVVLRGLILDGSGTARALRVGVGAEVLVEDAVLRNGSSAGWGGGVRIDEATVTFRRTTISDCAAEAGGGIYAIFSTLTLDAVTINRSTATSGFGGGIGLEDATLVARGSRFDGNLADDPVGDPNGRGLGGGLFTGRSTIDLLGCTFVGNEARSGDPDAGRGGAVRLWLTDAVIAGTTFETNTADEYGSAVAAASSELALTGSSLTDNLVDELDVDAAWYGGAVFCDELSGCTVTRSWFEANTAGDGGAICAMGDLTVTASMFCANVATSDAGAIDLGNSGFGKSTTVAGNLLALNQAEIEGGALVVTDGPHLVHNNHLVGNAATFAAAIASTTPDGQLGLEVLANLIAGNTSVEGAALVPEEVAFVEDYDWLWDNTPSSAGFVVGPSTVEGDPRLVGPVASCDPLDLALGPDSGLRDAGPPGDGFLDPDGSANDIGAFGGPSADPAAFTDEDGDGVIGMLDCADDAVGVHPGAPELCNGVDDDCDGLVDAEGFATDAAWSFLDADGDGVGGEADAAYRCPGPGWAATSDDCDDGDPAVAGEVTWYTDADGDGLGDPASAGTGCTPPADAVLAGGDCDDNDAALAADCTPTGDPPGDDVGGGVGEPPEPDYGCGCGVGPSGSSGLILVLLWIGVRPRRCAARTAPGAAAASRRSTGPRPARTR